MSKFEELKDSLINMFTNDQLYSTENLNAQIVKLDRLCQLTGVNVIEYDFTELNQWLKQLANAPESIQFKPSPKIDKREFRSLINNVRSWMDSLNSQPNRADIFVSEIEKGIVDLLTNFTANDSDEVSLDDRQKLGEIGTFLLEEIYRLEKADMPCEHLNVPPEKAIELLNLRFQEVPIIEALIEEAGERQSQLDTAEVCGVTMPNSETQTVIEINKKINTWIDRVKVDVALIYADSRYVQKLKWYLTPSIKNVNVYRKPTIRQLFEVTKEFVIRRLAFLKKHAQSKSLMEIELNLDNLNIELDYIAYTVGLGLNENYNSFFYNFHLNDIEKRIKNLDSPASRLVQFRSGSSLPNESEYLAAIDALRSLKSETTKEIQNMFNIRIEQLLPDWNKISPNFNLNFETREYEFLEYFRHVAFMIDSLPSILHNNMKVHSLKAGITDKKMAKSPSKPKKQSTIQIDAYIKDVYRRVKKNNEGAKEETLRELTARQYRVEKGLPMSPRRVKDAIYRDSKKDGKYNA
jgi:hypothetical protein